MDVIKTYFVALLFRKNACLYVPYRCSFYSCDIYFNNKNLFGKLVNVTDLRYPPEE
jgi:hypothetical protein